MGEGGNGGWGMLRMGLGMGDVLLGGVLFFGR